ncbi:MAG TPA: GldM family protein [Saprospiraceae bacterium]|nr:GldM family protein [Saprospiraceae bacterium]
MILIIALFISLNFTANLPTLKENSNNVLYAGVENQINIAINHTNPEDISVKVSSGNVYRRDDSTFAFNPPFELEEFKIKLYYKKVLCQVQNMSVKKIPEPSLQLVGEQNDKISMSDITLATSLKLDYGAGFPENLKNKVFSFNLFIKPKNNQNPSTFSIRSETLNEQVINFLKSQEAGTKLIFNNVLAIAPNGVHTRINSTKELTLIIE